MDRENLAPEQKIGNYVLLEKLGAGGIGEVWKARDRRLNRVVALKFLVTERAGSTPARDLMREARAASALNHPNIVTVFEVGESESCTYLAMEYVQGQTLRARMAQGPVPADEGLQLAGQITSGLAAAHREGITHRDLKPENVMIRGDGLVKILDFGLAKVLPWAQGERTADSTPLGPATQTGQVVGTFTYMSPEQARGLEVTAASDVFSLGIVLYELLCGQHPFRGPTVMDTLNAIMSKEPPPCAATSEQTGVLLRRALSKEPGQRYATAGQLAEQLERVGATSTLPAPAPAVVRHQPLWMKAIGGTLLAGLLVMAGFYFRSAPVSTASPRLESLAVLEFRASPLDRQAAPFAQGLAEEISTALSRTGLRMAAQSSVQELAGKGDPRTVGTQLAVDAVLSGTVRSYGSRFKIHLELVSTRSGFQVWTETFTAESDDPLASEQKAASEIAAKLRAAIGR
jgi:serine/threonine protein kinase